MCRKEHILHESANGSVLWCPSCDSFQLEYKVLLLAFKVEYVPLFLRKVKENLLEAKALDSSKIHFQFATPVKTIHLKFIQEELLELQDLLSVSLLQRELKKMFSDVPN